MRLPAIFATAIAASAALTLVACAPQDSTDESPAPSTTATPQTSTTPTGGGADTADWSSFATDDGEIAFMYPSDWTLESSSEGPVEGAGASGTRVLDGATLTAPNGQTLLSYADAVDLGGACIGDDGEPLLLPLEVLASEPLNAAPNPTSIATLAFGKPDGRWFVGVGVVDPSIIQGDDYCIFDFATSSSEGLVLLGTSLDMSVDADLWTVDTLDDARAYMETDEYATIVDILRTVELS